MGNMRSYTSGEHPITLIGHTRVREVSIPVRPGSTPITFDEHLCVSTVGCFLNEINLQGDLFPGNTNRNRKL